MILSEWCGFWMFHMRFVRFCYLNILSFWFWFQDENRITGLGYLMLVALYNEKMIPNLCCIRMRKKYSKIFSKIWSVFLYFYHLFLNCERTTDKRWLLWDLMVLRSTAEEPRVSCLQKMYLKTCLFHFESMLLLVALFALSTEISG